MIPNIDCSFLNMRLTAGSCLVEYKTKSGEKISVISQEKLFNRFFVEQNNEYREVKKYDVAEELRYLSIPQLRSILPKMRVSRFGNGDFSIRFKIGLDGGMLSINQLRNELRPIPGLTQLINDLDTRLVLVQVDLWDPVAGKVAKVGTGVAGAVVGGISGGALVAGGFAAGGAALVSAGLIAAGPPGWAILVAGGVGAGAVGLLGGVCGWVFASNAMEAQDQHARAARQQLEAIFQLYAHIQQHEGIANNANLAVQDRANARREISQSAANCYTNLQANLFIQNPTIIDFIINENKLKKIASYYRKENRDDVIFCVKYLILAVIASLPDGNPPRPIDAVIDKLDTLIRGREASPVKNACYVLLGKLYMKRQNIAMAIESFELVPDDSDYHPIIAQFLPQLRAMLPQRQI